LMAERSAHRDDKRAGYYADESYCFCEH
jgi:hypothetical protein